MSRVCHKAKRQWKSTKLQVYRLYLKELISSLNELLKNARTNYFVNLTKIKCCLTESRTLFHHLFLLQDCNLFLNYFIDRAVSIRTRLSSPLCFIKLVYF
ncbi:hypothetical protein AMECASPLE_031754 [Ameca splendens]|uniref:Uncharacterized protein n=1 Tax=Ameca splendens TaxID=208324 RepID=A0ABV1AEW5_9TELE